MLSLHQLPEKMHFNSIYRHGLARVAACTTRVALADPAANAATILRMLRTCDERGVAVAVFPELSLSAYAIDDLLLQDALLDGVEQAIARIVEESDGAAAARPLRRAAPTRQPHLQLRGGGASRPPARRRAEDLPAELPRISTSAGISARATASDGETIAIGGHQAPFGPDQLFVAEDCPDLVVHAEICEDIWVPIPPSARGRARRRDGACEPLGLATSRSARRRRAGSSAARSRARCIAAYLYAAAGAGESTTDVAWDGQADDLRERRPARRDRALPVRRSDRRSPTSISSSCVQERRRTGTFDDNRRLLIGRRTNSAASPFRLDPPAGDIGLERKLRALPLRAGRSGAPRARLLRGLQHPGRRPRAAAGGDRHPASVVIGVSGGLDSTQALIVAAKAFDRLGLAAQEHPRLHHAGLRHRRADEGQRASPSCRRSGSAPTSSTSARPRSRCSPTSTIPLRAANRSTTLPSRTCRPASAPTTSSASPTIMAASCSAPATSPSWRSAGAPTASAIRCRTTTSIPACRRR